MSLRSVAPNWSILRATLVAFAASQVISLAMLALTGHTVEESCRWDCNWYRSIAEHGYLAEPTLGSRGDTSNVGLFPFVPALAWLISRLISIPVPLALILVGKTALGIAIYWFARLCSTYRPGVHPRLAVAVAAMNPYAIYGNVGYTEPVFLAVTCITLVMAREGRVMAAGLVAAIGTTVRLPPVFLAPAMAMRLCLPAILERRLPDASHVLGVVLAPLGLTLFSIFEHIHVGDGLAFLHIQRAWHPAETAPVTALFAALGDGARALVALPSLITSEAPLGVLRELGVHRAYYAATAIVVLGTAVFHVRTGDYDLLVFTLGATLAPLTVSLSSMPRYVWWQAPLLLLVASAVSGHPRFIVAYFAAATVVGLATWFGWFSEYAFMV